MKESMIEEIKKALVDSLEGAVADQSQPQQELQKALRPEVTREQLYALVEALHEVIEVLIEVPEEDEMEDSGHESEVPEPGDSEDAGIEEEEIAPVGDPDKNEINWPIAKSNDQQDVKKSLFSIFNPYSLKNK